MQPKFKNIQEYEKAQILMQPIFIRVLDNIRKQSEISQWQSSYQEINEPFPSYLLSVKKGDELTEYNVWELCFKVCFKSYQINQNQSVETDENLIDETGEINWEAIENKTQKLITDIFV